MQSRDVAPASAPAPAEPVGPRLDAGRRFRPDIEGMRAVAVTLVVLYHAGVPFLSGGYVGVDVFFVLSGFLITGLLLDEVRRSGTISLRRFYARRARRLLPLAALVVVASAAAAYLLVPPLDRPRIGVDALGAALYAANWRYAVGATDYLGADSHDSPFLHFWSLAVEEQFYVVWPLLILLVVALGPKGWGSVRRRVTVGLVLLGGGSLVLSVLLTPTSGSWAYFGLHTRAWELAAGAAVALALPLCERLPRAVALVAAAAGLGLVLWSAVAYDDTTLFPGIAAAAPVGGAVLLLVAGTVASGAGVGALLSRPGPRYVGRISYAWYLWHWPCLVVVALLADGSPTAWQLVLGVVASLVLSVVSHVLVEDPVRRNRWLSAVPGRSLALGAGLTVLTVGAALLLQPFASRDVDVERLPDLGTPAASAPVDEDGVPDVDVPSMTAEEARADQARPSGCYVSYPGTEAPPVDDCVFGDPEGEETVALIGDSHSIHWLPAFDEMARERGQRLLVWGKTACPSVDIDVWVARQTRAYSECGQWRTSVEERLAEVDDLTTVFVARSKGYTTATLGPDGEVLDEAGTGPVWEAAAERTLGRLGDLADRVVVVQDTPWSPQDVPSCLSEQEPSGWRACNFPREGNVHLDTVLVEAEERAAATEGLGDRVAWLDMTDAVCPGPDECTVVAPNGAVVYADDSHFTNTWSRSAWTVLSERVDALAR
ncbi:acyltransferase family protein [Pseudokineococcus lusitanus]|uniref:Peptidoglycan/LPS O-acetylase OafA/YrhL n=1 Tax=Pseudokineococcus lusitanus TaxID=763993 RepID=A0A3N1G8Y2_9ACTN|nr:acyltransferase family protein [Pseudokineococcus lusitanus]ROP26709.1 peptidoglycan/LPS O-acetylase OafA/YrhL [Pseudokineococcus lusitanus]